MEILIEVLIEIFGEIFAELICGAFAMLFDKVFFKYTKDVGEKGKKIVRLVLFFITVIMISIMLGICLAYGKTFFAYATSIFILAHFIFSLGAFCVNQKQWYKTSIVFYSIKILLVVSYSIIVFVRADTIQNFTGRIVMIVSTAIGLIICLALDSFRIKTASMHIEYENSKKECVTQ